MQNYTIYVYKRDGRTKTGERAVATFVMSSTDEITVQGECIGLLNTTYPIKRGYRIEYHPSTKTVKNLMTGKSVEIDRDTPYCCDPSSEAYWSQ